MRANRSQRQRFTAFAVSCGAVVLALAACGSNQGGTSGGHQGGATGGSAASGPIKIGAVLDLTGTYGPLGKDDEAGAKLAVAQINAKGGIDGRKLQLLVEDDKSTESQGVTDAYGLVGKGVVAMLGPADNTVASAVAPIAERDHIPEISLSSDPTVVKPTKKYNFQIPPLPPVFAQVDLEYLKATHIKKLAIMYDTTQNYGTTGNHVTVTNAPKMGINVVGDYPYQASNTDFSAILAKLKGTGAQAFMVWGGGPAPVILAKQFAADGLSHNMKLIMTGANATALFTAPAGAAANGIVMDGNDPLIASQLPASAKFTKKANAVIQAFKSKYGRSPSQFAFDAYTAMQILIAGMQKASPPTSANIDQALNNISVLTVDGGYHYTPQDHGKTSNLNNTASMLWDNGHFLPTPWEKTRFSSLPK